MTFPKSRQGHPGHKVIFASAVLSFRDKQAASTETDKHPTAFPPGDRSNFKLATALSILQSPKATQRARYLRIGGTNGLGGVFVSTVHAFRLNKSSNHRLSLNRSQLEAALLNTTP